MPIISESQIARIQTAMDQKDRQNASLRQKLREGLQVDKTVQVIEVIGSGALAGAARAKFEKADGSFNIGTTSIDIEFAAGVTLVALGYFAGTKAGKSLKKAENHLMNAGMGVMAHYAGQVARNSIKGGKFTAIAGSNPNASLARALNM